MGQVTRQSVTIPHRYMYRYSFHCVFWDEHTVVTATALYSTHALCFVCSFTAYTELVKLLAADTSALLRVV
jgi:hypothetical protein